MIVFVQVNAAKHDPVCLKKFAEHSQQILNKLLKFIQWVVKMTMLKVVVADMQSFDVFYKKWVDGGDLSDVTLNFAMEQIKYTTALPV
jgi:Lrp/AsnC family transcriptional regulator